MTKKEFQAFLDAVILLRDNATDQQASLSVDLYPKLHGKNSSSQKIVAGTRINWNGIIKRATVDLWDREENFPDKAQNLWEDILYYNGVRIIPETITVGLAFSLDEKGWWEKAIYICKQDNCVWTPEQAPDMWRLVNND